MPTPHSRNEKILMSIIDGVSYTDKPHSREEALLLKLKDIIEAGGGGLPIEQIIERVLEKTDTLYEPILFEGTRADWNALTKDEKSKFTHAIFTDESKLYKYDKDHNTISVVVGDLSEIYNMIAPFEYDLIADKAYAVGDVFYLKANGHNKFYKVTKDINIGEQFVFNSVDPELNNITDYGFGTLIEAIESARNVTPITDDEIDEMFENL